MSLGIPKFVIAGACSMFVLAGCLRAQGPANVLLVVNDNSSLSREIGEYYARRRGIPFGNICRIRTSQKETIARADFDREIAGPIGAFLRAKQLVESILYIVTTAGVPLRVAGTSGSGMTTDNASVDSELTLLYADIHTGR
ncbi:MAG TPA: TIGR03790 family protein, partial [Candidatus Limnocylindrales bacterium]|nr:TIGR03790 family protein [Candidatus Limnocylindrales bacterium]